MNPAHALAWIIGGMFALPVGALFVFLAAILARDGVRLLARQVRAAARRYRAARDDDPIGDAPPHCTHCEDLDYEEAFAITRDIDFDLWAIELKQETP